MLCKHFGHMQLSLQGKEGIGSTSLLEALVLKAWQYIHWGRGNAITKIKVNLF